MARTPSAITDGIVAALATHGPMTGYELLAAVEVAVQVPAGVHEGVAYGASAHTRRATAQELKAALDNGLRRSGKLERVGHVMRPGTLRACTLYDVREPDPAQAALATVQGFAHVAGTCQQASDALRQFGQAMWAWHSQPGHA